MKNFKSTWPELFFKAACKATGGLCSGWIFLTTLSVYLLTSANTVQEADSGQFLALGHDCLKNGWPIAHPPGYPIQTALSCGSAWLAQSIPTIPQALWLSWTSAGFTALAAALSWAALTRLGIASPINAATSIVTIYLSRDVWRAATTQEPFGLGILTLAAALFLPWLANVERKLLVLLCFGTGLAFGLGFANHHTTAFALVSAVFAFGLIFKNQTKESLSKRIRPLIWAVAGFLIGALPIAVVAYRILTSNDALNATPIETAPAFTWITSETNILSYLFRTDYGTFSLATNRPETTHLYPTALQLFLQDFVTGNFGSFGWIWAGISSLGIVTITFGRQKYRPILISVVFAGIFLILNHLPASNDFIDIIRRFHPMILVTILPVLATGIETLTGKIPALRLILLVCSLIGAVQVLPEGRRDLRTFPEEHFTRALEIPPQDAIVIAASDEEIFGLSYGQVALKIRPDLRILNLLEWGNPDKRHQALQRIGITPEPYKGLNRGQLVEALAKKYPLWIIDPPIPPKPQYMNNLSCAGPYEILDLRATSIAKSTKSYLSAPVTTSQPWYASDESLLIREQNCLEKQQPQLLQLRKVAPSILQDLRYATTNNFTGVKLYASKRGTLSECWLLPEAATMLAQAQKYLQKNSPNLSLMVFDCARPESVQEIMWDVVKGTPQQQYVADPKKGSVHNYGCAVDLSLVKKSGAGTWQEVDMGTPFDHFGDEAHTTDESTLIAQGKISHDAALNRLILRKAMTDSGFIQLPHEWWHYDCMALSDLKQKHRPVKDLDSLGKGFNEDP